MITWTVLKCETSVHPKTERKGEMEKEHTQTNNSLKSPTQSVWQMPANQREKWQSTEETHIFPEEAAPTARNSTLLRKCEVEVRALAPERQVTERPPWEPGPGAQTHSGCPTAGVKAQAWGPQWLRIF